MDAVVDGVRGGPVAVASGRVEGALAEHVPVAACGVDDGPGGVVGAGGAVHGAGKGGAGAEGRAGFGELVEGLRGGSGEEAHGEGGLRGGRLAAVGERRRKGGTYEDGGEEG